MPIDAPGLVGADPLKQKLIEEMKRIQNGGRSPARHLAAQGLAMTFLAAGGLAIGGATIYHYVEGSDVEDTNGGAALGAGAIVGEEGVQPNVQQTGGKAPTTAGPAAELQLTAPHVQEPNSLAAPGSIGAAELEALQGLGYGADAEKLQDPLRDLGYGGDPPQGDGARTEFLNAIGYTDGPGSDHSQGTGATNARQNGRLLEQAAGGHSEERAGSTGLIHKEIQRQENQSKGRSSLSPRLSASPFGARGYPPDGGSAGSWRFVARGC